MLKPSLRNQTLDTPNTRTNTNLYKKFKAAPQSLNALQSLKKSQLELTNPYAKKPVAPRTQVPNPHTKKPIRADNDASKQGRQTFYD